jgi:hypothetical protein
MLHVSIPNNNLPEREYIIEVMLTGFLGLPYSLTPGPDPTAYHLCFDGAELVIRDHFFSRYPSPLSYLVKEAIPLRAGFLKNRCTIDKDIPVIYGNDEFHHEGQKLVCGIDLFGSSFFMLARWEEAVLRVRDIHNRFPGRESLAVRGGFLHRPVVNEYAFLLWNMLVLLGYKGERKSRSYGLVLTHDVDHLDYPSTCRILLGDLLKRHSITLAHRHLNQYRASGANPYDYFDFLMTHSEKLGLRSHFYFMSTNSGLPYDRRFYLNKKCFHDKVREIRNRGHLIGFHPGYYTCDNEERWRNEKELLERVLDSRITEGRQHYLRFDIPLTFRIWERNGMETDSTLGYAEYEGFRCGTGDDFHVFDVLDRNRLHLKERPLVIMDGTLKQFKRYDPETMVDCFRSYLFAARKYQMQLTILFHNCFYGEWEGYDNHYVRMLESSFRDF